jgi:hypothetical protein
MPLVNVLINSTIAGAGGGKVQRGNAPPPIFLDYLLVGGGGYSANYPDFPSGAAGGGGGVVSGSIRFLPRFTLDVTVGNGGTGSNSTEAQASIIDVSSPAGEFFVYAGGGQLGSSGQPQNNPKAGDSNYSKGGAGGSSSPGFDVTNNGANGGVGGSGSVWTLDNIPDTKYAGGGGGFGTFFIPGEARGGAGQGGGGNGAQASGAGGNGAPNTGGGAGGSQPGFASNGGSGIVKMRYLSGSVMGATGGTTSVSGGYVYHTFTGSGQFVYQP